MNKVYITNKLFVFFCIHLCLLPTCTHKRNIDKQDLHVTYQNKKFINTHIDIIQANNEPPPITIYVHGTLIFRKPYYYKVFKSQSALAPVKTLDQDHYFYHLARAITDHDPIHFPLDTFYIFGWSGKLREYEREHAAQHLYANLVEIVAEYKKKYNTYPIIRIIAHSHGGNVALNMANIEHAADKLNIKSLILLACPVQEKTMHLIKEPIFKRVYSLYSSFDIIQIIAPQIYRYHCHEQKRHRYRFPPFSSRRFPPHQHLTQAKVKINGCAPSHTTFITTEFVSILPTILRKLDHWHDITQKTNAPRKQKLLCIHMHKKSNRRQI